MTMQIGVHYGSSTDFPSVLDDIVAYEGAGLDVAWLGESYGYDSPTALGALAARTSTIRLGPAILAVQTRSAALIAMTAAGLDAVSNGRALLCLGSSGPAVVEGLHDRDFGAPVAHTRLVIEQCRALWAGERLASGRSANGAEPYRGLKLIHRPDRTIPIYVAAVGDRNVAMAGEIADGWMPVFFWPERARDIWAEPLALGSAMRSADLGELQISVTAPLAIDVGTEVAMLTHRAALAHYIGGMGTKETNFYLRLATRYGFGDVGNRIQDLYLAGERSEAIELVPDEFACSTALIGDEATVAKRLAAYRAAGVTILNVIPQGDTREARVDHVRRLLSLAGHTNT
jgi:F420-dependent oxidoreductase-like protein